MNMKYSVKVFEKEFSNEKSKVAYLNACKWLANNLFSKVELSKVVSVQINKDENKKLPTFIVSLFVNESETDCRVEHCKQCKTINTIFYQVTKPNCNECKMNAYKKRLDSRIEIKANFVKEIMNEKEDYE